MGLGATVGLMAINAAILLGWWVLGVEREASPAATRNLRRGLRPVDVEAPLARQRRSVLPESALAAATDNLIRRAEALTPPSIVTQIERRILLAGQPAAWPRERVFVFKLGLGLMGAVLGLLFLAAGVAPLSVLSALVLPLVGYFTPDLLLLSRAQERQKVIERELPDTLDQITICVEAGLGFEAAMARTAQTGSGPLAQELGHTLQDIRIGVPRAKALRDLSMRTEVAPLRHFVLAVIQAESYGIPIATVLRVQAAEIREKRRQSAEERAMKLPVKVVFPLIFCIMPALFIVVIGPAAIRLSRTTFGGG